MRDKIMDLTTYYFERSKKTVIKSRFRWMMSAVRLFYIKEELHLDQNTGWQALCDYYMPYPINISKLATKLPLTHLYLASADGTDEQYERIEYKINSIIKRRSLKCSLDVVSPRHSNMFVTMWIINALCDVNIKPLDKYYVGEFGIWTDDFHPSLYGWYCNEKNKEVFYV